MSGKTAINGTCPCDNGLNDRVKRAYEIIALDESKKILFDIESGEPQIVSKEYHEKYLQFLDDLRPKMNIKSTGKIIVFGTAGSLESNNGFEKIWNDNKL